MTRQSNHPRPTYTVQDAVSRALAFLLPDSLLKGGKHAGGRSQHRGEGDAHDVQRRLARHRKARRRIASESRRRNRR